MLINTIVIKSPILKFKTMKLLKLYILLFASALLFSCGDDDSSENKSPITGTWKTVSYETREGAGEWEPTDEACRLDDTEEYKADGSWTKYDGTNQCSAGTGIIKGTWALTASDTKIVYTYDGFEGEYESTVEQLSEQALIITSSAGDLDNTQYRATYIKK